MGNTGAAEEGEDGGDDDEDENEAEESPKKTPKAAENKPTENKPAETKPAGKAKASPKAKGKAKAKADAPRDELDPEVLKSAKDLGFETALRNLASREELKENTQLRCCGRCKIQMAWSTKQRPPCWLVHRNSFGISVSWWGQLIVLTCQFALEVSKLHAG